MDVERLLERARGRGKESCVILSAAKNLLHTSAKNLLSCHSRPSSIYVYKSVERESRNFMFTVSFLYYFADLTYSQHINLSLFRLPSLDKGREKLKNSFF